MRTSAYVIATLMGLVYSAEYAPVTVPSAADAVALPTAE
jgi:hypothetical protein